MESKILIVEDDKDINDLIDEILKRQGYETVQAFSGTEAALRMEMQEFQLIILDLMLPGMNGETLLKNIREKLQNEIPVLVLSARSSLADKVQLLTAGADDYMTKPFEPEELAARVYSCLRRGKAAAPSHAKTYTCRYINLSLFTESRRVLVK